MQWNWRDKTDPNQGLTVQRSVEATTVEVVEIVRFEEFSLPSCVQADGNLYWAGVRIEGHGIGYSFWANFTQPSPNEVYKPLSPWPVHLGLVRGLLLDRGDGHLPLSEPGVVALNHWLQLAERNEGPISRYLNKFFEPTVWW
ncbi:MAG TPA: hypothetical protein VKQ72_05095 [Aggregatilineales bacterium]|nr:hypothetical protein [Aggregatilineales bacterium]